MKIQNLKQIMIKKVPLKVKVANTKKQKSAGLQNVDNLPNNHGMLFCYPKAKILSFWMKDTIIPLSIAFIDENKIITQIEDLDPRDMKSVKSKNRSKWALEVNKGWFEENNINVGDEITTPDYKKIKIHISNR